MNRKFTVLAIPIALAVAAPTFTGGYEGILEIYKLERSDGSVITMYERPDMSSPVLATIHPFSDRREEILKVGPWSTTTASRAA